MNYSDPIIAADLRDQERRMAEAEEADRLYGEAQQRMLSSLNAGDANAVCAWAPRIKDWARAPKGPMGETLYHAVPERAPTVAELVRDVLLPDQFEQPGITELVQLALNAASGRFGSDALREQANMLLGAWGALYADQQEKGNAK